MKQIIDTTSRRIHAAIATEELYNEQTLFNLMPVDQRVSLGYLAAILNSWPMTIYHRHRYLAPDKVVFQKLLIRDAKTFPIRLREYPCAPENNVVSALLSDLGPRAVKAFYHSYLQAGHRDSDGSREIVECFLEAGAWRMQSLHTDRVAEQNGFLEGAEELLGLGVLGKGLESFKGKSILLGYAGDYQRGQNPVDYQAIRGVLGKNKSIVGQLSSASIELLERRFEASVNRITAIQDQLRRLDWLIDQAVYWLYEFDAAKEEQFEAERHISLIT